MSIRRTLTKGVALATLLLLIAAPAGAATSDTTARGTAAATSVPLHVEALGQTAELGRTVLMATTDSDRTTLAPWSTVQLTLAALGGQGFGQVDVSSDGTTTSEVADVNESNDAGTVSATAGNVLALADDTTGTATAVLTALTTEATVLNALGLKAAITDTVATVNDDGATATHSLAMVDGVNLDLAHVLGSVLSKLPLEDLIALADELGVAVPVNLDPVHEVVNATEELAGAIAAAVDAAQAVDTTLRALSDADNGTLTALQGLLAELQELVLADLLVDDSALEDILADDAFPEGCVVDLVGLDSALLTGIETCLQEAIDGHLASLGVPEALTTLETAITTYVAAVGTAASIADTEPGDLTVSETLDDITELIEGLLTADLLGLGPIDVSQRVHAVGGQPKASSATHTCEVTTIAALGADPIEIANCDGTSDTLTTVVDTITGTLRTLLDSVGGIDAGEVSLELFGTVADTVTEGDDGWVRATSVMEVLALTVPDITIDACEVAEGLICGLGIDVEGTLATVLGLSDDALTTAQATIEGALDGASELLAALEAEGLIDDAGALIADIDNVDATAVQEAVNTLVTLLTGALNDLIDELSLGTAGGIEIPGAKIVVDPTLEAEHQVTTASVDDPTGADPAPDPDDDSTLPNTGGGAALLAILALGAGAWLWRRRGLE